MKWRLGKAAGDLFTCGTTSKLTVAYSCEPVVFTDIAAISVANPTCRTVLTGSMKCETVNSNRGAATEAVQMPSEPMLIYGTSGVMQRIDVSVDTPS